MTHAPRIAAVTDRIRARSRRSRAAYRAGSEAAHQQGPNRSRLSCGNLAHAFAACGPTDKGRLRADATPNLGIVDDYNDLHSAHQPLDTYPALIREAARALGVTALLAGGDTAMFDDVTQGRAGIALAMISQTVLAQATAKPLSQALDNNRL